MPLDSAEFGLPSINSEADSSVYFSSASTTAASDIQAKLQQMEIELSIAGQESRDFQSKLLVMEDQLLAKVKEIWRAWSAAVTAILRHFRTRRSTT